MNLLRKLAVAVLVAVFGAVAYMPAAAVAADNVNRFPLKQEFVASIVGCIDAKDAVAVASAIVEAQDIAAGVAALEPRMAAGVCAAGSVPVTFVKQVYYGEIDGTPVTVYEARVLDTTFYVPLIGFLHEGAQAA